MSYLNYMAPIEDNKDFLETATPKAVVDLFINLSEKGLLLLPPSKYILPIAAVRGFKLIFEYDSNSLTGRLSLKQEIGKQPLFRTTPAAGDNLETILRNELEKRDFKSRVIDQIINLTEFVRW